MITTQFTRFLFVCLLLLGLSTLPTAAQRKTQVAVLDFGFTTVDEGLVNRVYGGQQNLARQIADNMISTLVQLKQYQVVERSMLDKIRKEQNLFGVDDSTVAKAGHLAGADWIVTGTVTVLEVRGQQEKNGDRNWDPRGLKAKISINYRVIDTTSGVVKRSNLLTGESTKPPTIRIPCPKFLPCLGGNREEEAIKDVVRQATDDVVGKIIEDLGKKEDLPQVGNTTSPIWGTIVAVNGPSLVIKGINKASATIGIRLEVRQMIPADGGKICYTTKIGMAEIMEVQDQVVIASFLDSAKVNEGDFVISTGGQLPPQPCAIDKKLKTNDTSPSPVILPPAVPKQVEVLANRNWTDTGIDVQSGKQLEIVATGKVKISPTREVEPSGLMNRPAPPTLPLPGKNIGALIAKICYQDGKCSPVLLIGAQEQFPPVKAGRLMLGVNDSDVTDNSGSFSVTVRW